MVELFLKNKRVKGTKSQARIESKDVRKQFCVNPGRRTLFILRVLRNCPQT